jgi:flagellar hook-associated protein 1 FlgK
VSIPTLQGLQTALSGLLAEQQAIDTTGNNIANANTEGYSRQSTILESNEPLSIPSMSPQGQGGQLGTGVSVQAVTRIRNTYLDAQYRSQNATLSLASTQSEILQQTQSAFDEPSSNGLSSQLSTFWSAWSSLANAPTSEAAKEGVVSAGTQLASTLNQLTAQISSISGQASEQYAALTGSSGEVQDYANQIAQLNQQIKISQLSGQEPNTLLDRRDELLDKLSSLAQITVSQQADGTDTVTFGDAAKPLVEGATVNWPQTMTGAAGGQLGALLSLTAPNGTIASYQSALSNVASALASSVNSLQPKTPFFSGTTAATIAVAVTPSQVQSSLSGPSEGNEAAQAIAALRGGSTDQSYATLIEKIGSDVQNAQNDQANSQTVVSAINSQRQSVSGVSLDEEMTNLISFQRGYEASARTMTAMDAMLETLIEHTGAVGL